MEDANPPSAATGRRCWTPRIVAPPAGANRCESEQPVWVRVGHISSIPHLPPSPPASTGKPVGPEGSWPRSAVAARSEHAGHRPPRRLPARRRRHLLVPTRVKEAQNALDHRGRPVGSVVGGSGVGVHPGRTHPCAPGHCARGARHRRASGSEGRWLTASKHRRLEGGPRQRLRLVDREEEERGSQGAGDRGEIVCGSAPGGPVALKRSRTFPYPLGAPDGPHHDAESQHHTPGRSWARLMLYSTMHATLETAHVHRNHPDRRPRRLPGRWGRVLLVATLEGAPRPRSSSSPGAVGPCNRVSRSGRRREVEARRHA
jgi:hypothetical protein